MPTSPKARNIVKTVNGHIITLSEDSLKAVNDIGQYHFPKQVQSVTFGGTNIIYGFPSGMHGMVYQRRQNTRLCINR